MLKEFGQLPTWQTINTIFLPILQCLLLDEASAF